MSWCVFIDWILGTWLANGGPIQMSMPALRFSRSLKSFMMNTPVCVVRLEFRYTKQGGVTGVGNYVHGDWSAGSHKFSTSFIDF